jgi:N-dimethylarginine dimethylaminohydrolase
MAYLSALAPESQTLLRDHFRERLLTLSEEDGENFAANSFQLLGDGPALFMPHRASARLRDQVRERGVEPVPVDVSEFLDKGGGSVKCLIGDLGWIDDDAASSPDVADFRRRHGAGR